MYLLNNWIVIDKRIDKWKDLTGNSIDFYNLDLSIDYDLFLQLLKEKQPDTIVHFAEQKNIITV